MTPAVRRTCVRVVLAGLGIIAFAPVVSAQSQEDAFRRGLEARQRKNWPEAANQMRRAIQIDPRETETRKVRIGATLGFGGTEYPYLPHFYLGEALITLKDCAGAVGAWAESERQRVVKDARAAEIQKGYETCEADGVLRPGAFEAAQQRAQQKYGDAAAALKKVAALTTKPVPGVASNEESLDRAKSNLDTAARSLNDGQRTRRQTDFTASMAAADRAIEITRKLETAIGAAVEASATLDRLTREVELAIGAAQDADAPLNTPGPMPPAMAETRSTASGEIARARQLLGSDRRTQAALREALEHAQAATSILTKLAADRATLARVTREQQIGSAIRVAENSLTLATGSFAALAQRTAQRAEPVPPEFASERDKLQQQFKALEGRVARARQKEDVPALTEAARLLLDVKRGIEALLASFGPLTLRDRGVPAALEEGARRFLRGEYRLALDALTPVDASAAGPLRPHLHVFRAASLFALYVRSGDAEQTLLTQAVEEITRCKEIDPSFQPDARAFAPRFIALFREGRAPDAAAPKPSR
jgi:tetratricopeptide (TPR) repeat protein